MSSETKVILALLFGIGMVLTQIIGCQAYNRTLYHMEIMSDKKPAPTAGY